MIRFIMFLVPAMLLVASVLPTAPVLAATPVSTGPRTESPAPVLAQTDGEAGPVLSGEARWGGSLQWHAFVEPGSKLVWAFIVQRDADRQLAGPQVDVRHATTIDESGYLSGLVRVDFLHLLAADLYFWAEWRRPDGTSVRGASEVLPAMHRERRVDFLVGEPARWVNGVREPIDMAPMLDESRVFVPIRHAAEPFGATFTWDQAQQKATMYRGSTTIEMVVDSPIALVNGVPVQIDPDNPRVVPQLLAGRVLVPVRFVSDTMGITVEWIGREARVVIQTPA